jgi:hypothetical protein
MGSKPDTSAADTANQQAAQQAAEARQKEVERQARLDQGKTAIENTFSGSPVMGTKKQSFDWGSFAAPSASTTAMPTKDALGNWVRATPAAANLPSGYTAVQVDDPNWHAAAPAGATAYAALPVATPAQTTAQAAQGISSARRGVVVPGSLGGIPKGQTAATNNGKISGFGTYGSMNGMQGGGTNQGSGGGVGVPLDIAAAAGGGAAAQQGPGKVWAVRGPDGQLHYQGQNFDYDTSYDTGQRTGGFGEDFYSGISRKVMDLGNVDITDQYNKARENLQYALARQGLSSSSAANQGVADTEAAKAKAQGDLSLQAQDAATQVRSQVDQEKQAALAQLYATEDPSLSANTALGKATNIRADQPAYSGLGDIFGSVIQGFGNVYSAARNAGGGYFAGNKSPSVRPAGG